jgi:hypothetical protein
VIADLLNMAPRLRQETLIGNSTGAPAREAFMEPQRITADEVKRRINSGEAVVFLDSRGEDAWQKAELQIPKSIRVPPGAVEALLDEIPRRGLIVPYCT